MALFVVTGLRGRDFGHHWDEVEWQLMPVRRMVEGGHWIPPAEIYPGLARWLVLIPALPAGLAALFRDGEVRQALAASLARPEYLLEARSLFIVVSALAILWLYLAARALGRPVWEATVAAAGLALSWEYAYHSRWLATDCIVAQFSALTLYMLARFQHERRTVFLYGAAIGAALATGTKYPAWLLLVPVGLASVLALPLSKGRAQAQRLLLLGAVAAAAYLVTSPATVLDAPKFVERMHWIQESYARANAGFGVASTWGHWGVVTEYFALAFFSPYRAVAGLLFVGVVLGAVATWREDRHLALVVAALPLAFLAVIGIRYRTVVIRNYLLMAPFLALFMARGLGWVAEQARGRPLLLRVGAAALGLLGLVQAWWLIAAGESIRHMTAEDEVRDAFAYVGAHPRTKFQLSPRVRELGDQLRLGAPPNTTSSPAQAVVLFARTEGPSPFTIPANDPFFTLAVLGPREVNFDWYSTWTGRDRVIVMSRAKAKRAGVAIVE
jgi:4-amino-4-deoxy-L-arabinose transferase-like glycosyltransferase